MEIYKLTDEITEKPRKEAGGKLVVTEMKQGVKNPNRVNIFINGKYELSLDLTQVVDLKVKIGKEVTAEELQELKKASEYGKLYQRALEWALTRPRSERELRDYLRRKTKENDDIDKVIEKLKNKKYVNDEEFARFWVENRFVKKGVSRRRLTQELRQKGISSETIDKVLEESGRDERGELKKMIERKRKRYDDEKLLAYLVRQGFPYDLVKEVLKEIAE